MAKATKKIKVVSAKSEPVKTQQQVSSEDNIKEVIGSAEAEALQKSGWQFISATPVEDGEDGMTRKKYKFKKE